MLYDGISSTGVAYVYQTCEKFELNSKTVPRWIKDEKTARRAKNVLNLTKQHYFLAWEDTLCEEYSSLQQ